MAADAVFDEPAAIYDNNYQPIERVYNASDIEEPPPPSVMNSFSPPIETEGNLDNCKNVIFYLFNLCDLYFIVINLFLYNKMCKYLF